MSSVASPPSPLPVMLSDFVGPAPIPFGQFVAEAAQKETPKKERKHKEKGHKHKKDHDPAKEAKKEAKKAAKREAKKAQQQQPVVPLAIPMGIPIPAPEERLDSQWTVERGAMTSKYGFKKVRVEWELVLDGKYHRIRLFHSLVGGKRELEVDSVVVDSSKKVMDDGSIHVFHLGNPASPYLPVLCCAVIGLSGVQFTYELEVPMGTRFAAAKKHYLDGWFCGQQAWHKTDQGDRRRT